MSEKRIRIGVVMDPISKIKVHKDSTFAMLLAAQKRGWDVAYMEQSDLRLRDGVAEASMRPLTVRDQAEDWCDLGERKDRRVSSLDVVLMRKDPPFDMEYIYTTYVLERAEIEGTLIVNRPASLRDVSEKVYTAWFAECGPPTLMTRSMDELRRFAAEHEKIVVKPLDGMGGRSIFVVARGDANASVIFETITDNERTFAMAQRYIPQIMDEGDKRILLIEGEPVPYALARIPARGESRGNLAAGALAEGRPLTDRDRWICSQLGPTLREKGLIFVGLDVIGDYVTEINVTSPTCIRELDALFDLDIGSDLLDAVANRL